MPKRYTYQLVEHINEGTTIHRSFNSLAEIAQFLRMTENRVKNWSCGRLKKKTGLENYEIVKEPIARKVTLEKQQGVTEISDTSSEKSA